MRESVTLFVVKSSYWLQHLHVDPPRAPTADERSDNVLLYPAPDTGGVSVMSGTFDGPITVTIETGDDVAEQDPARWDLTNTVELVAQGQDYVVSTLDDVYDDLGLFELERGDRFTVRLYARGVQTGRDAHGLSPDDEPVEQHLVQIWRA